MADHESAVKRQRQNKKRNLRNRSVRAKVRLLVKELRTANKETAKTLLPKTTSALHKAAHSGVLHHRMASRTISRLEAWVHRPGN